MKLIKEATLKVEFVTIKRCLQHSKARLSSSPNVVTGGPFLNLWSLKNRKRFA